MADLVLKFRKLLVLLWFSILLFCEPWLVAAAVMHIVANTELEKTVSSFLYSILHSNVWVPIFVISCSGHLLAWKIVELDSTKVTQFLDTNVTPIKVVLGVLVILANGAIIGYDVILPFYINTLGLGVSFLASHYHKDYIHILFLAWHTSTSCLMYGIWKKNIVMIATSLITNLLTMFVETSMTDSASRLRTRVILSILKWIKLHLLRTPTTQLTAQTAEMAQSTQAVGEEIAELAATQDTSSDEMTNTASRHRTTLVLSVLKYIKLHLPCTGRTVRAESSTQVTVGEEIAELAATQATSRDEMTDAASRVFSVYKWLKLHLPFTPSTIVTAQNEVAESSIQVTVGDELAGLAATQATTRDEMTDAASRVLSVYKWLKLHLPFTPSTNVTAQNEVAESSIQVTVGDELAELAATQATTKNKMNDAASRVLSVFKRLKLH